MKNKSYVAKIRVRIGHNEAHYAGNLVDGARILQIFGDLATELLIQLDGDEGLFKAYEMIEFMAPVKGGDYIVAEAKIINVGKTSRKIEFIASKVITNIEHKDPDYLASSSAKLLKVPILICKAVGTCVTPQDLQRKKS